MGRCYNREMKTKYFVANYRYYYVYTNIAIDVLGTQL